MCECEAVTRTEIRDAIDQSGPDLNAVRLRTRASMGNCQGGFCTHRMGAELYHDHDAATARDAVDELYQERWKGQRHTLWGQQLSQAMLNHMLHATTMNHDADHELREADIEFATLTRGQYMAIESDVLVIGGGLAGVASAVTAAREGVDVRLVSHKKSTLRQASGLIDGLGYVPARTSVAEQSEYLSQERKDFHEVRDSRGDYQGPLVTPYEGFDSLPDEHPYTILGANALREGLDLFDELVGDLYLGAHTERNALVPTFGGAVKPTARYPRSAAAGLASDERSMLVVGFRSLSDFDAEMVAEQLEAIGVPFDIRGVEVAFVDAFRADAKITRVARALDHDETIDGTPARQALAEAVKPHIEGATRIGFPAFIGDDRTEDVRADLADRLGADVFEIPMGPPSLPGLRLEDRLFEALDDEGVKFETGVPVVGFEPATGSDRHIETVLVDRKGSKVPYSADSFVLAAGGLVGKGLNSDREGVREPIFDSHVPQPSDRYDWFVDDAFGDQPYARFGIQPDSVMRPLDATSTPEFSNLFAAGAVVGGADVAREKSASGVSLATGLVAGRSAAAKSERTLDDLDATETAD